MDDRSKVTMLSLLVVTIMILAVVINSRHRPAPIVQEAKSTSPAYYNTDNTLEYQDWYEVSPEERAKWSLLRDIIACESAGRWEVAKVPGKGYEVGPCRTSTMLYAASSQDQGLDLFTPSTNMRHCIQLFEAHYPAIVEGKVSPWERTRVCWEARQRIRKEQAGEALGVVNVNTEVVSGTSISSSIRPSLEEIFGRVNN
jgi:hypothetical protein